MKTFIGLIAVAVGIVVSGGVTGAQMYTITDLGTLGGDKSVALAVSDGQVAGRADIEAGITTSEHAFSWTAAGGMVDWVRWVAKQRGACCE